MNHTEELTIQVCPRCQQRFQRMPGTGDFQHDCFGNENLANEDIVMTGPWQDYTGSDATVRNALMQGNENTLFGTRAAIEGAKNFPRTSRGFPSQVFRTRRHIEHIDESNFKQKTQLKDRNPEMFDDSG